MQRKLQNETEFVLIAVQNNAIRTKCTLQKRMVKFINYILINMNINAIQNITQPFWIIFRNV